ncbi:MAG: RNA polymerase sigma factor [Clostridiales bacterium]|nr:RNA polymerase sigma factor [Clostridiales bacterium]
MDKLTFMDEVKARERQMYRIARSYGLADADCCDAVQEALLRAWAKRDTLRNEAAIGTWLIRILINECKTALRKRAKTVLVAELPQHAAEVEAEADPALEQALFALPAKYRVPLVLNVLDGYTLREIAQMLTLPEGTVKSRVSRAKKQLGTMLMQEVNGDETY